MILVIDNYDSFTYNLVQYLGKLGAEVEVRRNDAVTAEEIVAMAPDGILLSPGPCSPSSAGICLTVLAGALNAHSSSDSPTDPAVRGFFARTPTFGVCLGMQSIGFVSGAEVGRAKNIMHGKTSMVSHDGKGLFEGIPSPFRAVRYHSLVIREDSLGPDFEISARSDDDGEIMGVRHRALPIEGVQFHPESVMTDHGLDILRNFVRIVDESSAQSSATSHG